MDARKGETHLVLFFDVNGTIMANDSAKNKAREVALLQILAEKYSAVWDAVISTDVMSYRQFLAKFHVTTPTKQEADLQLQNGYNGFINFLRDTNHALFDEVSATYAKMNSELSGGDLFPSFIKMIRDLKAQKKAFSIILRSFGSDTENVVKEIEGKTNINFTYNARFNAGSLRAEKKVLVHPRFILADILPGVHGVWADDYKYWHGHGELHTHGKLYPIDLENDKKLTIFFDDNALDKQILCMRPTTGELTNDEQIAYQAKMIARGYVVAVDTLQAILNPDYFNQCLQHALQNKRESIKLRSVLFPPVYPDNAGSKSVKQSHANTTQAQPH